MGDIEEKEEGVVESSRNRTTAEFNSHSRDMTLLHMYQHPGSRL